MRPYFLVVHNRIRLFSMKLRGYEISADGIQMFSRQTEFSLAEKSRVTIGDRFVTDGSVTVHVDKNASIVIGEHVYCNRGTIISCKSSVWIGSGCRFGPNVMIFDNNHKFDAAHGVLAEHTAEPVVIGKNCWLGANVVVLKGTVIGDNCVIGAGCVVSGTIPNSSVVTQDRDMCIRPIKT